MNTRSYSKNIKIERNLTYKGIIVKIIKSYLYYNKDLLKYNSYM